MFHPWPTFRPDISQQQVGETSAEITLEGVLPDTTEAEIKEYFSQNYGHINRLNLKKETDLATVTVEMATFWEAESVVADLAPKGFNVRYTNQPSLDPRSVSIKNIAETLTPQEITDHCVWFGKVTSVKLSPREKSLSGQTTAIVRMSTKEAAVNLIRHLHGRNHFLGDVPLEARLGFQHRRRNEATADKKNPTTSKTLSNKQLGEQGDVLAKIEGNGDNDEIKKKALRLGHLPDFLEQSYFRPPSTFGRRAMHFQMKIIAPDEYRMVLPIKVTWATTSSIHQRNEESVLSPLLHFQHLPPLLGHWQRTTQAYTGKPHFGPVPNENYAHNGRRFFGIREVILFIEEGYIVAA